jgi:hypothetical protein
VSGFPPTLEKLRRGKQVSGVWGFGKGFLSPDTSYESSLGRNREMIERRTSNVQHRTSNIDDAALYRFYSKRAAACNAPFGHELMVEQLPSASSGLEPVESSQIEFRRKDPPCSVFLKRQNTLFDVGRSMFDLPAMP